MRKPPGAPPEPPVPPAPSGEPPKPRGGGLGGIFANVKKTATENPFAGLEYDRKLVVKCRACGAPQERPLDFKCVYCKAKLLSEEEGSGDE